MIAVITLALVCLVSCASAKPYERENLSKPAMDTSGEEQRTAFCQHVFESREGGKTFSGRPGAGCGCN